MQISTTTNGWVKVWGTHSTRTPATGVRTVDQSEAEKRNLELSPFRNILLVLYGVDKYDRGSKCI